MRLCFTHSTTPIFAFFSSSNALCVCVCVCVRLYALVYMGICANSCMFGCFCMYVCVTHLSVKGIIPNLFETSLKNSAQQHDHISLTSHDMTTSHYATPRHTTPDHTTPHHTTPHHTTPHHTTPHHTTPHHTRPHHTTTDVWRPSFSSCILQCFLNACTRWSLCQTPCPVVV